MKGNDSRESLTWGKVMNNIGFFRVLGFTAAVLVAAALALQATAAEIKSSAQPNIQWVWSVTSLEVNSATSALASGHLTRAARIAGNAAATVSSPADRLIAVHNLCLARLAQGDIVAAEAHCRAALLTPDATRVIWRRGALVTVEDSVAFETDNALALAVIIRANVTQAYGAAAADSFASTAEAALW